MTSASKVMLNKPILILLYGFPGSGKTAFARQLSESVQIAHVQADRIRHELFDQPRYDKQENDIVSHLMNYMTEEFLGAGVSVAYDADVSRSVTRRELRDMARRAKAEQALVWLQIDPDSALARTQRRDRRKQDDKYAFEHTPDTFRSFLSRMQNPMHEDYVVISGKHAFSTQRGTVLKRLYEMHLVNTAGAVSSVVKPELVNLIPNRIGGRFDITRRNVRIR